MPNHTFAFPSFDQSALIAPWRIGSLVCYRIDRFDLNIIDVKLNIERAKQQPQSCTNFFRRILSMYSSHELNEFSPSRLDGVDINAEKWYRWSYCEFLKDAGMKINVYVLFLSFTQSLR